MPKKTEFALAELERRWRLVFDTLAAGGEVPPSVRLRTEGYMEAVVALGLASEAALQDRLEACYLGCFGEAPQPEWRRLFPFPQVPGFGERAPVYPSTSD